MSHYKPYPAYKESGVEWLGQVPEHWNVVVLSRLLEVPVTDGPHETPEFLTEGIPFLSVDGIQDGELVFDGKRFISEEDHLRFGKKAKPKRDDLLLGKAASVGKIARVKTDMDFNIWSPLALIRIDQRQASPSFVEYSLKSTWLQAQTETKANLNTQFNLGMKDISKLLFCVPPPVEQKVIARLLDRETARIDALVEKKTRFIELLREKRQALITHAVTKGLDPNVKMKDSGVEWLGEVPEGWEIKSVRHVLAAIGDVDHFMPESVDNGVPYLMTGDLKDFLSNVSLQDCKQVSHGDYFKLSRRIKSSKGDIVMARYATIGALMYVDVDVDFLVSYSCVTLKPDLSKMSGLYLFHYMKSTAFHEGIKNQINTNTQDNVGIKDLQSVKIAVPPIEEQAAIAAFLDFETTKLDALKNKIERSIELLKERRSALITAAVTGQIDLREAA